MTKEIAAKKRNQKKYDEMINKAHGELKREKELKEMFYEDLDHLRINHFYESIDKCEASAI